VQVFVYKAADQRGQIIVTSENKKAVINVSTSVPIVTSQQVPVSAGGNTDIRRQAGGQRRR
jgi:type II secretory pathway component GspD/PulD (secretin)